MNKTNQSLPKRKKQTHACDNCRKHKKKCDGLLPKCSNCSLKDLICTYLSSHKKRGRRSSVITNLEDQLSELEKNLEDAEKSPLDEDVRQSVLQIPSKLCKILVNKFFDVVDFSIQFLDKSSFLNLCDQNGCPPTLLYSILSLSSNFCSTKDYNPGESEQDIEYYRPKLYQKVTNLAKQINHDKIELHHVQTYLVLSLCEFAKSNGFQSWKYAGKAVCAAQKIGLNLIDSPNNMASSNQNYDYNLIESKRRTWWFCFIADRFGSSLIGRPLYIDKESSLVSFPNNYATKWNLSDTTQIISRIYTENSDNQSPTETSPLNNLFFEPTSCYLQIYNLVGEVTQFLLRKSFAILADPNYDSYLEYLTQLDNLERSLENWVDSLPSIMRETDKFLVFYLNHYSPITKVMMYIMSMYYSTTICLNRASIAHIKKHMYKSYFNSSYVELFKKRCEDAACAIIDLAKVSPERLEEYTDAHYPFSVFNALTIFVNIKNTLSGTLEDGIIKIIDSKIRYGLNVLEKLEKYWLILRVYIEITKKIDSVHKLRCKSVVDEFNWVVPYGPGYFDWYYSKHHGK